MNSFRVGAAIQSKSAPTIYRIGQLVTGCGLIITTNTVPWVEQSHVFSIPADWAPPTTKAISVMTMGGIARFDIRPDGGVWWFPEEQMATSLPAGCWISLDDFSYTIK